MSVNTAKLNLSFTRDTRWPMRSKRFGPGKLNNEKVWYVN